MKTALFIAVMIVGMCRSAMADTLSYWSVRLNDSLVLYGNVGMAIPELRIAAAPIEPLDVLTVRYFRDTPCSGCPVEILIKNTAGEILTSGVASGTLSPVHVPAYPMLQYVTSGGRRGLLSVFFQEGGDAQRRMLLFKIRLE